VAILWGRPARNKVLLARTDTFMAAATSARTLLAVTGGGVMGGNQQHRPATSHLA
jgi:hypothetical protein